MSIVIHVLVAGRGHNFTLRRRDTKFRLYIGLLTRGRHEKVNDANSVCIPAPSRSEVAKFVSGTEQSLDTMTHDLKGFSCFVGAGEIAELFWYTRKMSSAVNRSTALVAGAALAGVAAAAVLLWVSH